jgi:hypothetical protein
MQPELPHQYGLIKTTKQIQRQQAVKRHNDQTTDLQAFLERYFKSLTPKQKKLIGDEYEIDEDFWIIRKYLIGRKQYAYSILTTTHYRQWKLTQARNKKMTYTPSTGGQQKYKTVPRNI